MQNKGCGVITFHSTSHAIQAEKVCRQLELNIKMIPTPRRLSSDCGISLRFDLSDREAVLAALAERNVAVSLVATLD